MMICPKCNHRASDRTSTGYRGDVRQCSCTCHDLADTAPGLLADLHAVVNTFLEAAEPIDNLVRKVETCETKGAGGHYRVDGKTTLLAVTIPLPDLLKLRHAIAKAKGTNP